MGHDEQRLRRAATLEHHLLKVEPRGPASLAISGELAVRDPVDEVGPFIRAIHEAARGCGTLEVDVRELRFINSSALRLFIDWVSWIQNEPEEERYRLAFVADRATTWQSVSFPALLSISDQLTVHWGAAQ